MPALFQQRAIDPVNSNALIVQHPLAYKRDGSKPAVIHAHGFTGSENEAIEPAGNWYRATHAIASAGYPVVAGNLGGPAGMGNATVTNQIGDCLAWARTNVGAKATGKYFLSGTSMGALGALNRARIDGIANIAGIILWVPGTDLVYAHDKADGTGYPVEVEAAYGGNAGYLAALPTRNPQQYGPTDLAGIPILCFHSSDDGMIANPTGSSVQTAFLNSMAAVSSVTRYVTTGGHNLTGKDLSALKAWMDARA